jgi:hypothetical protein
MCGCNETTLLCGRIVTNPSLNINLEREGTLSSYKVRQWRSALLMTSINNVTHNTIKSLGKKHSLVIYHKTWHGFDFFLFIMLSIYLLSYLFREKKKEKKNSNYAPTIFCYILNYKKYPYYTFIIFNHYPLSLIFLSFLHPLDQKDQKHK